MTNKTVRFLALLLTMFLLPVGVATVKAQSKIEASRSVPSAAPIGQLCRSSVGTTTQYLKPKSQALYGENTNVYIRRQNPAALDYYYILYKRDHYYPWGRVGQVLQDCTRADLLRWMKGQVSTARTMKEYAYIGEFYSVALKGESVTAILKAWCSLLPKKQQQRKAQWESGQLEYEPYVYKNLQACK